MPKDNIERAIKKAAGADGENYDEVRYEGYAPGGVAVIVEALTDNRNRTAGEVRSYFTKAGGALAETGAVSFMFDHVGQIEFDAKAASEDAMMEAAIEAGAEDVASTPDGHEITTTLEDLVEVHQGPGSEIRRAEGVEAGLEAAEQYRGGRRSRRKDLAPDRRRWKTMTTCRTLRQFRNLRRSGHENGWLNPLSRINYSDRRSYLAVFFVRRGQIKAIRKPA